MENKSLKFPARGADYFLDITKDVCPLTFVRTKLLIERMTTGETAEVRLKGAEPLTNIPRSVKAEGHTVLDLRPEDAESDSEVIHRLRIKKN